MCAVPQAPRRTVREWREKSERSKGISKIISFITRMEMLPEINETTKRKVLIR